LNAELTDELTGIVVVVGLMSEQMGFPLRQAGGGADEKREEDSNSSQVVCGHLVAHHVVPVTNFIWMKNRNTVTTNLKRH